MEDISKLGIRDDLGFDLVVGDNLVGDDDILEFHLFRGTGTLQMGHWLFLLMTRILYVQRKQMGSWLHYPRPMN